MKLRRHAKLIELISEFDITTQAELAEKLCESGFTVTQATVSRDIRELKLTKILTPDGLYKYTVPSPMDRFINERYIKVFRESVVAMDYAQNILVIRTLLGTASAVAAAFDSMHNAEAVGCIAGNDIIFCVVKTEEKAIALIHKLKSLVPGAFEAGEEH